MGKYYERFETLLLALTLSGLYFPSIEKIYTGNCIKLLKGIALFPMVLLPLYTCFALKLVFYDDVDLDAKMSGVFQIVYSFFSSFVVFSFYHDRKDFIKVFERWDELFQDELFTEDRKELLETKKKVTDWWLKIFGTSSTITAILYTSLTYLNEDKKLNHPVGIPYKNKTPEFEMVATYKVFFALFCCITVITYDSLTMVLLSLEEAQFLHLKKILARILDEILILSSGQIRIRENQETVSEPVSNFYLESDEQLEKITAETNKKVAVWISHHQQILEFHKELRRIFHVPLSVKYIAFVLEICLGGFLLLSEKGLNAKEAFMTIMFCINNYTIFYVNIKFADSIQETARSIFEEAFATSWFIYPKNIKTIFEIILKQCTRPVEFVSFQIFPLNSNYFFKILSSAYSFFMFLIQVTGNRR